MSAARLALVTGVSRQMGLGYETARQLKERGFEVIMTARDRSRAQALAGDLEVIGKQVDVTDEASITILAQEVEQDFGHLDVLINNAGGYFDQGVQPLDSDLNFVKDAFNTNLLGAWRMIKAFYPLLLKSNAPRIVNVSSGAGSFGDPVFGLSHHFSKVPAYGISKLALNGLTVKMAVQLKDSHIKINSVDPGFTATYPGTEQWGARPVSEGASGIVWAATLPDDGPSGQFFRDAMPLPW